MIRLATLFLLLLAPACTIYPYEPFLEPGPLALADVRGQDGGHDVYELDLRVSSGPHLNVRSEYPRSRPFLGLKLRELDKAGAEQRGVAPYSGLLVTGTYPKSAAEAAAVLAGDVLLSIAGKPIVYLDQVQGVEALLQVGDAVNLQVLRGQTAIELAATPRALLEQVRDDQSVPLELAPPQPYAGAGLAGIPAVWCEKIYGKPREAVVLTGVEIGGPAWLAGFRSGDVVDAVDNGPTPSAAALRQLIVDRAPEATPILLQVSRGGRDEHTAQLIPRPRGGTKEFWFPLVFHLRDGVYQDKWSVGPFGLIMRNKNRYLADVDSRRVATRNEFSAVLGLIRVETDPDETDVRLLWLIHLHL